MTGKFVETALRSNELPDLDADMAALVNHFKVPGKRPVAMRREVCCDDGSD